MPSLITFDEALELGRQTGHDEIGELVERAWQVRRENFGDSTDMCSLVNAKSGGCAEDCGFCAQSRYAEADTPMHAMLEPEQILEHAKAAEAAGAHRFCMVTQGQGLSKRDFQKILEGTKLVVCRVGTQLYAYRSACPGCASPLDTATVEGPVLRCGGCGAAFDLPRAGRSLDGATTHLDPLPLVEDGGEVRIAVVAAS